MYKYIDQYSRRTRSSDDIAFLCKRNVMSHTLKIKSGVATPDYLIILISDIPGNPCRDCADKA